MLLMILTKINKSCHESCHEITEPLIFQGFWNLVLWVQVLPLLIRLIFSIKTHKQKTPEPAF